MYSEQPESGIDEKSCGAVLYQRISGEIRYLIVQSCSGHISFPKGHMEEGETEWETACREIGEETGITGVQRTGVFRESFRCLTAEGKRKEIIYFLAEFKKEEIRLQEEELEEVWLLPFREACDKINTAEEREILRKADLLLTERESHE